MSMQVDTITRNNIKLTWEKCASLPDKVCVTSAAELDGSVYAAESCRGGYHTPFMYNSNSDQWLMLPELPC